MLGLCLSHLPHNAWDRQVNGGRLGLLSLLQRPQWPEVGGGPGLYTSGTLLPIPSWHHIPYPHPHPAWDPPSMGGNIRGPGLVCLAALATGGVAPQEAGPPSFTSGFCSSLPVLLSPPSVAHDSAQMSQGLRQPPFWWGRWQLKGKECWGCAGRQGFHRHKFTGAS